MTHSIVRAALLASALATTAPAIAAPDPASITGTYALPDGQAKVSAILTIRTTGAPPGSVLMDVAMAPLGAARPITHYEVELSKRLHLIAVSDDFGSFVHEHGERPAADGHFRVTMELPRGGAWHIYADAVPAGLGQQVIRFELNLDSNGATPAARPAAPPPTGLDGADGRYAVRFEALDLRAGQEAQLTLHVLRDGRPAPDVTPFLGVAAHAVFIDASDLTYIHVHATQADAPMPHDMAGMGAPLRAGSKVPPDLSLHVRAPKAGTYLLWLQFSAGGQVRTVRFVVPVS